MARRWAALDTAWYSVHEGTTEAVNGATQVLADGRHVLPKLGPRALRHTFRAIRERYEEKVIHGR